MRKGQYSKLENEYSHQWDAGGDDAQGSKGGVPKGGVPQEGSLQEAEALPSPSGILRRRSDEEKPLEASQKQKMLRSDSKKSPSDPLKPIKLKLIPRNVQLDRCGKPCGASLGAARVPPAACSGVCAPRPSLHTAVAHASGAHTVLRNVPPPSGQQGLQTPVWFPGARCGRRCSSPQTPMFAGCTPFVGKRPPRSAQTSPSAPKSPKLTSSSSDPWSQIVTKNYRAGSIGGGAPPGEMEWLAAPTPRSRKGSWSSASTDYDFSPCW
ncbi:uncharacterized protein LOC119593712 [Penaeus monodon]|uniref:uncharacterized protein LOC119593712 n=1 Tax=Penaeus monodon TaxID=6687 RepID=UPI0018A7085C|nr:uncharacterized protein LOC119593712 [Penaeus monodon]XP_037798734.1 uncharacterized protein LOC119593712 [Penaeus monodon]